MTKKIAFILIALFAFGIGAVACSSLDLDSFTSTGQLGAKINQAEAQGWMVTSQDWNQIYYLVPPTPPYQTASITLGLTGPCVTDENGMTMCGKALRLITADVYVMKNGNCKVKNVQ